MGLNVKVSASIHCEFNSFCTVTVVTRICRTEQGDVSGLKEYLFMKDLSFSIKVSCDIFDA